jgi:hypothetical protein
MCRVIKDPFKGTLRIHLMQSIACSTNPQNILIILENCPHFIVYQAMDIVWIMQVAGKCAGLFVQTIQSSVLGSPSITRIGTSCSNPKGFMMIFIQCTHLVAANAGYVICIMAIMYKFSNSRIKTIKTTMCAYPKYSLMVLQNLCNGIIAQACRVFRVVAVVGKDSC